MTTYSLQLPDGDAYVHIHHEHDGTVTLNALALRKLLALAGFVATE